MKTLPEETSPRNFSPPSSQFSFHKLRKLRMYFAWLFILVLAIFAKSTDQGFFIGIPVIFLGECIRIWSHGYIQKTRELAIKGPYAYVRNPLYVGNFLMGLGFCLIIWHPVTMIVFLIGFYSVYWVTVKGEEQILASKFGEAYQEYLKHVPRFIPRLTSYGRSEKGVFVFARVLEHGEHITILAIISFLLFIYLRQELYQGHRPFSEVIWPLIVYVSLGILLMLLMGFRSFRKRQ